MKKKDTVLLHRLWERNPKMGGEVPRLRRLEHHYRAAGNAERRL